MTDRILTPVIALGLAFLVWMYTRSRDQERIDNYPVPVEVEINPAQAADYEPEKTEPRTVNISFVGPPSRIREFRSMLDRGEVRPKLTHTVPEDRLQDAKYDVSLRLDPAQVPAPPGVATIITESQNRIPVVLWKIVERPLPVRLMHDGGGRVEQAILEPSTVKVRGRKEIVDRLIADGGVPTQQLTVSDRRNVTQPTVLEDSVALVYQVNERVIRTDPANVKVRFTLKPVQSEKELTEVPVHFLCPANFPYRPEFVNERAGKITVRILGPATEDRPAVTAYVDLTARNFGRGLHAEEPLRIQMPPGFQLVGDPPRLSSFRLVPLEGAAKTNDTVLPDM